MNKQLKHSVAAAVSAVPYTFGLAPARIKSHSASAIGTNYQAGGNIAAFAGNDQSGKRNIQGNENVQNTCTGDSNYQAGQNLNGLQKNEIGNSNQITQAGRDICSIEGSKNTGNALGSHNIIHNHFHSPAYEHLLSRYLELVDKYTHLLEQRTLQSALAS